MTNIIASARPTATRVAKNATAVAKAATGVALAAVDAQHEAADRIRDLAQRVRDIITATIPTFEQRPTYHVIELLMLGNRHLDHLIADPDSGDIYVVEALLAGALAIDEATHPEEKSSRAGVEAAFALITAQASGAAATAVKSDAVRESMDFERGKRIAIDMLAEADGLMDEREGFRWMRDGKAQDNFVKGYLADIIDDPALLPGFSSIVSVAIRNDHMALSELESITLAETQAGEVGADSTQHPDVANTRAVTAAPAPQAHSQPNSTTRATSIWSDIELANGELYNAATLAEIAHEACHWQFADPAASGAAQERLCALLGAMRDKMGEVQRMLDDLVNDKVDASGRSNPEPTSTERTQALPTGGSVAAAPEAADTEMSDEAITRDTELPNGGKMALDLVWKASTEVEAISGNLLEIIEGLDLDNVVEPLLRMSVLRINRMNSIILSYHGNDVVTLNDAHKAIYGRSLPKGALQ